MKSIIVALSLIALFASCKNPAPNGYCDIAAKTVAPALALSLNCKDATAIATDLNAFMVKKNICSAVVAQGPVGDVVCPMIASYVMTFANGTLPAAWQCDLHGSVFPVQSKIEELCKKAVTM